jgi:signal transduction histidine kinase
MPDVPVRTVTAAAPRRDTPRRPDVVAAAVTLVLSVAGLLALPALAAMEPAEPLTDLPPVGGARWWAVLAALVAQAVAVAWARPAPRAALLAVGAVPLLLSAARPGEVSGIVTLAVVVVVYRAVVAAPSGRLRAALVACVVLLTVASAVGGGPLDAGSPPLVVVAAAAGQALGVVALGLVPALVVGSRRAVREAEAGELRALQREGEARLQAALATERTAMARELHDIAAHHLSGIALMASAIDRQITTDPDAARQGLRQVRDQSRVVLTDLRRLVGLLRDDDGAETSALTLAAVPGLVTAPGAGDAVTIDVLPAPGGGPLGAGVGPLAQLAAYRMVQEALANARVHAPGAACRVTVDDRAPDAVVLTVRNGAPTAEPPTTTSGGYGLRGMSERAALVGADLRHGPTPDGGWEVRLSVPRDRAVDEARDSTVHEARDSTVHEARDSTTDEGGTA